MYNIQKKLGDNVRTLRLERGYSQEVFAELVGVHRTYIGMIERGEKNVTLETIVKLSRALDTSISDLIEGID
ncbi:MULTISPECIES: helix-turn-helix domain-containing protein [Leuconostoc]|uniref:helix-turn-helix domain-containing protein n=1 Tax=Leuconostoc TaxID=1243 RepID=UPI0006DC797E|nr:MULTISPECIES: helix-turn-helix transcriptional regulator [Leuconostoc]KQB80246.1 hypothetical protein AN225_08520 [Leuconostoc lactis]MBZ5971895.1 helix-turn-helix transcriptional regulator [Leuconostoc gasicomitatum]MDY5162773.1 helix-turn-helix transcriptional regulator [Leuconostoc citreum]MDY5166388.1 helix-turn-helix transcriptional regulator [Leuconostoc citreum]QFS15931.1 transcriptional regulator [Leuconostoc gasicomitatum]